MTPILNERIQRAKYLLNHARHATMATVNADGSPHNSPFLFIHDKKLEHLYWASDPNSLHCQNALRTGQLFVVVFESETGSGLYIPANEALELSGADLEVGLQIHNAFRAKHGKDSLPLDYYSNDSPQRMYRATPTHFYVNVSERDEEGRIIRDYRQEINLEDLTG